MKNQPIDFSVNLLQALLWRHNSAPNLQALLEAKQAWYDANFTGFWNDWVRDVFDLRTANDFGCAVWAIILGIPISIVQDPAPDKVTFGFSPYRANFHGSNFGIGAQALLPLTLEQKRLVLRLRYFQLFARCTVPQTNRFLKYLFKDYGPAYVIDNHDMSVTFVFGFVIPSALRLIFSFYDLLPHSAATSVTIVSEV